MTPEDQRRQNHVSQMSVVTTSACAPAGESRVASRQPSRGEGGMGCEVQVMGVRSALGVGVAFPKSGVSG
jgi:hypothetical protein